MLLHKDKELFKEVIISTAENLNLVVPIVEKDYYVTMILKELSLRCPECVFKGGTSLSKCHHIIDRFSEDIDITFSKDLSQGKRKSLKNEIIAGISNDLKMPILDWENTRSRRDYNCYTFSYEPIEGYIAKSKLIPGIKMEVVLSAFAFPTVKLPVGSYVYDFLVKDNKNIIEEYNLTPFIMNVQDIARTLIDKVFAICDYYLQNKITRCSRHIYDIHMLFPKIQIDKNFIELIKQVRLIRKGMNLCLSAADGIDISSILEEIISKDVYKKDYLDITTYFQKVPLSYEQAIETLRIIAQKRVF